MQKRTIFLIFIILLLIINFVQAKSYYFPNAKIDITVNPDSSLTVNETLTFNFDGTFSYAYRDLYYDNEIISDIKVYEIKYNQLQQIYFNPESLSNNVLRINWQYNAFNEQKQFLISYKLKNAINLYNDVAEFYWKIWPDGWNAQLQELQGTFTLPSKVQNPKDVYTYGHPKLDGKIAILENQKIIFQAFNIPKKQWVELRVIFPSSLIKDSTFANKINSNGLGKILSEENKYTNYGYLTTTRFFQLFLFFSPTLSLIMIFVVFYFIWGREPSIKGKYNAIYERDIPYDYSPAIVSSLFHQHLKKPNARDFIATILYLCTKNYLKMEVVKKKKILGIFGKDRKHYRYVVLPGYYEFAKDRLETILKEEKSLKYAKQVA